MIRPRTPDLASFSVRQLAALYEALHVVSETLVAAEHDPRFDQPAKGLMGRQAEYLDDLADYLARQRDDVVSAMEALPRPRHPMEEGIWAGVIVAHEFACNGASEVPELVQIAEAIRRRNGEDSQSGTVGQPHSW
jgi:hypothetical protein